MTDARHALASAWAERQPALDRRGLRSGQLRRPGRQVRLLGFLIQLAAPQDGTE